MSSIFDEGCLRFDFSTCGTVERFDIRKMNPDGMKSVDFVVESSDRLYFFEIKDFQNAKALKEQKDNDLQLLENAANSKETSVFVLEMGEKIKDSLLRWYAEGNRFTKKITYLLFIRCDALETRLRLRLFEKISGHVPTGLNKDRFSKFTEIDFDLVDGGRLEDIYHISCTEVL